jgi:hypothetical protein
MRSLRWLAATLVVMAGLAVGCGTSGPPGSARSPTAPASRPATSPPSSPATAPSSPLPASSPAPSWPATARSAPGHAGSLTSVAAGQHAAFDRIVFHFKGGIPGYRIGYVSQVVSDPKGDPVPLPGQAFLRVVFHPASGYGSYTGPAVMTPMLPALLQVRAAGDFEGYLSFAAGISQRAGFEVFTLTHPNRVVIDIAHTALPPFPGIWDIISWPQFWRMQAAVNEGHQPWRGSPLMVVHAWAAGHMTNPAIRKTGPDTFTVTEPSTGKRATVTGTRPVTVGPAQLWVITKITYTSR